MHGPGQQYHVTGMGLLTGVYSVLNKRRAHIVREDLREGSTLFSVHAFLPAASSFALAGDMRALSSGEASPSLMLSHWQRLQVKSRKVLCT